MILSNFTCVYSANLTDGIRQFYQQRFRLTVLDSPPTWIAALAHDDAVKKFRRVFFVAGHVLRRFAAGIAYGLILHRGDLLFALCPFCLHDTYKSPINKERIVHLAYTMSFCGWD